MAKPPKAASKRHAHEFSALWWHFGPYGDQNVHVHSCFTERCDRVLIGDGRTCDHAKPHRRDWLA